MNEEYPGDQCWTCGWTEGYDVFIQARQHGGCRDVSDRACVVSEYGDWEYYAQNAGLAQDAWADLAPDEANSRQLRWHGEAALLQQATNFQEAHNDNRKTIAFADGLWVMFDYNRGYAPDIESSGCMDLFRLPKFAREFFRSQRPADVMLPLTDTGPMVFIASHWTPVSTPDIRVFSNCDEVALVLNGEQIERRSPDADRISTHLANPPFTFRLARFEP
ncbi:MAG: glycoside hydrolase family 2, partial [Gemmatimonadota bacterium]